MNDLDMDDLDMDDSTMKAVVTNELTYEQFVVYVRSALHYLYDPVHLRSSPLVEILKLTSEFDRSSALQQILSEAIRNLKPDADEAPQSRAWRIYDTLNFLYVRQLDRATVAVQLGISERQFRREQRVALERLAQHLWSRMDRAAPRSESYRASSDRPAPETNQALNEELVWLKNTTTEQRMPLGEAINQVQNLAQPLAQQWQVPLQVTIAPGLAEIAVSPLALRSILLTILSVALPRAGQGAVLIAVERTQSELRFTLQCTENHHHPLPFSEKEWASLQTAQELASFYEAQLSILEQYEQGFTAKLTLRAPEQIPILVIDDNVDWLELLQRYAADSHYQVVGIHEPEHARHLAEQMQPAIIFLDVMMHNVDGWQVLSELRNDPSTEQLPIVICTILPVEELALSLGANLFLQKPVTRQQFLAALNHLSLE